MDDFLIPICASEEVKEGGKGVRFPVIAGSYHTTGFVVRYQGLVYGYLNRCAHVPIELDWNNGDFFDMSGAYLMCSTHGALYSPQSGRCMGGPCNGGGLRAIAVIEKTQQIFWQPDEFVRPAHA